MSNSASGSSATNRGLDRFDPSGVRNRLEHERSRILTTILTAGACVSGGMLLLVPLWRDDPLDSMLSYGLSLLLHLAHLALLRRAPPLLVARSFSIIYFVVLTAIVYAFGGVRGLGSFVYPLVVLFTGLTWSARAALGMAAAASAVALGMALLESRGFRFPTEPSFTPGSAWGVVTAAVTMMAVMLLVALRAIRESSAEALENETRRRELELDLANAHRMEALGQLAGGLAHDFNNMLAGIIGHAELLTLKTDDEDLKRHAQLILRTGERAASLTQQLLTFSRKRERVVEPVAVNALVSNTAAILERSVDPRIKVELTLRADPDLVEGDPAELESALLNLLINARDAMPTGGILLAETQRSDGPAGGDTAGVPSVRIRVSDTGIGIPEEHRDHVFEPYFTTKEGGKGTGLGLATVYGTIQEHGGSIEIERTGSEGTSFVIALPAIVGDDDRAGDSTPLAAPATRRLCVLIVDDEPTVLDALGAMLEKLGHESIAVEEPLQALDVLERRKEEIDLLIVDLVMPKLTGRQFVERMRALGIEAPVILATGSLGETSVDLEGGGASLLPKPYRTADVARAIEKLIGHS